MRKNQRFRGISRGSRQQAIGARAKAKKAQAKTSNDYKTSILMRFVATLIDISLAAVLGFVFLIWGWWQVTTIIVAAYLLVRDGLPIDPLEGRSVGKKLVGLHVEDEHTGDDSIDLETSVKRNMPLAGGALLMAVFGSAWLPFGIVVGVIPFIIETALIIKDPNGLRYGDQMAGTKVLD